MILTPKAISALPSAFTGTETFLLLKYVSPTDGETTLQFDSPQSLEKWKVFIDVDKSRFRVTSYDAESSTAFATLEK
jgi:hypothetical protein